LFYVSIFSTLDVKFEFLMSWVELTRFLVESSRVELKIWATRLELSWKCEQLNLISIRVQNVNLKLNSTISLCNALQMKESKIFFAIQDFKKVFSEILFDSLNIHNQMKHFIDLMKSKMFCVESIYKMTWDEFTVIWNYLNSALKKK